MILPYNLTENRGGCEEGLRYWNQRVISGLIFRVF